MKKTLLSLLLFSSLCVFAGEAQKEVWPAESDIMYGSSSFIQFRTEGYGKNQNLIVGKGNVYDHRYRLAMRIPLDRLLPKGYVNKAKLSFRMKLFAGTVPEREYYLEVIDHNAYNITPNDLQASKVKEVLKFKMNRDQVGKIVTLDVTDALNEALENVWNGVIFRLRQDPEPNDDDRASGPAIFAETIVLTVE